MQRSVTYQTFSLQHIVFISLDVINIILSLKICYCPSWAWTHPSFKLYGTPFSSFCEVLQSNQQTGKQHTQIKAHYTDADDGYLQLETPMTAAQSSRSVRSLTPAISGSQTVCESSGGHERKIFTREDRSFASSSQRLLGGDAPQLQIISSKSFTCENASLLKISQPVPYELSLSPRRLLVHCLLHKERWLLSLIPRSSTAEASGWMSSSSNLQWVALNTIWGLHRGVRLVCRVLFASVCPVMDAVTQRRLFGNMKHRAKYFTRLPLFHRLSRFQIYRPAASQPGQQLGQHTRNYFS